MRKKEDPLITKWGRCGFFYSEEEMFDLVQAFYNGKDDQFESRLQRLDAQDKSQKDRAIVYSDEHRQFGNSLIGKFSHADMSDAIASLPTCKEHPGFPDFHEYALRIWIGNIRSTQKRWQNYPEVKDQDIVRATVFLSQQLAIHVKKTRVSQEYRHSQISKLFKLLPNAKT